MSQFKSFVSLMVSFVALTTASVAVAGREPTAEEPVKLCEFTGDDLKNVNESSGLAPSRRYPGLFWTLNDDGPSEIHLIDTEGSVGATVEIKDAKNRDWEELAAFRLYGKDYLMICDTGNNTLDRYELQIYIIAEPKMSDEKVKPEAKLTIKFPDQNRYDMEAVIADAGRQEILLFEKHSHGGNIKVYRVPLKLKDETLKADKLCELDLPKGEDGRVSGAALCPDGRRLVLMTEGKGAFEYVRSSSNSSWKSVLEKGNAIRFDLPNLRNMEGICYDPADGLSVVLTSEQVGNGPVPMWRVPRSW